jgi:NAD(P)-dependent dehydrogenase (short-subunit alcohol dehydrogenase family)
MKSFADKVVVITGASSGIGRALAGVFAREGAQVVVAARNLTELQLLAAEVKSSCGAEVLPVQADVTRPLDNEALVLRTVEAYGRIDIFIANAGMTMRARLTDSDLDSLRHVFEVNFWGALYGIRAALPHVAKQRGSIVGISSIAGYRGLPGRAAYSGSKFALNGLLEVVRTEYLEHGVHVLTASPGFTQSNIRKRALKSDGSPGGESFRNEAEMMNAEECAEHIVRAIHRRRSSLVLTLQGKLAVWLNKFWPRLADRLTLRAMKKEKDPVV